MSKKSQHLEESELWQLAKKGAGEVREAVKSVPNSDYYIFAMQAIQNATCVTSDIAYAFGKGTGALPYDFQAARGHLMTTEGLLLMAAELGFVHNIEPLKATMHKLQAMIEAELDKVENKAGIEA